MAPIRVGLIGLSGALPGKYEGTSWTSNAHLPYLKASPNYEIVALLNSSVESAKQAIERYELPAETKAYGNPEDLAADDTVDLVVCSVRIDRHFLTVRPSIIAGKAVFVEWPLDRNLAIAKEMAHLAVKHSSKTMVGLQGSFSTVARKMKETIESGRIGKVLSSSVIASVGNGGPTEVKNVRYFVDREVGGNITTIHFGHEIEVIASVLGEFKSWETVMANRHEFKDIIDPADGNKVIVKDSLNTVPDQIMMHGIAASGAPVMMHLRGGKAFPGTPETDWRIQGEKGELRVTATTCALNVGRPTTKIELFDAEKGAVETLVPDTDEWDELPVPAHNIARLYEAYRKGEWFPDFEWAVKRHEMIDEMWKKYDETRELA